MAILIFALNFILLTPQKLETPSKIFAQQIYDRNYDTHEIYAQQTYDRNYDTWGSSTAT